MKRQAGSGLSGASCTLLLRFRSAKIQPCIRAVSPAGFDRSTTKRALPAGGTSMTTSFDQLDGFIWMNGEFVEWADAKIHVLTHGLHYASAVFEGERAYGGEIFKLTEHNERLH